MLFWTGVTVTAVVIVYIFVKINRSKPEWLDGLEQKVRDWKKP